MLGLNAVEGLSQQQSDHVRISVTPSGSVLLAFDIAPDEDCTVALYDVSGRRVCTRQLGAGHFYYEVPVGGLPEGIYAVQVDGPQSLRGSSLVRLPGQR